MKNQMGIIDRLFRKRSQGAEVVRSAATYADSSGIATVATGHQATAIAAVYRCVDILSSSVACLPFRKMRLNRAEGYFLDVDDRTDPTARIIGVRPNAHQNAFEFMRNTVVQVLLLGNAYIVPRYGRDGVLTELILCSPNTVQHNPDTDTYIVNDLYNAIYGECFTAGDILHIRNLSLDGGRTGISTVRYAAGVLGIQATADSQTRQLFAKGGRIKGIINNAQTLQRGMGEYSTAELDGLASQIAGQFQSGKDIVSLPGDAAFTPISMSAIDMQLLEHRKFGVLEICRFFGVHPDKVFAGTATNYKASDMAQVSFIQDTLQPMLRKIEAEFQAKLIPAELSGDFRFRFDLSPLMITDLTTEADYMTKTIAAGVMTVNEWRRRKDLRPVEGGDETLVSCNVAPLGSEKIQGAGDVAGESREGVSDAPQETGIDGNE